MGRTYLPNAGSQATTKIITPWILPPNICLKGTPKAWLNWAHRFPTPPPHTISPLKLTWPPRRTRLPWGSGISEGGKRWQQVNVHCSPHTHRNLKGKEVPGHFFSYVLSSSRRSWVVSNTSLRGVTHAICSPSLVLLWAAVSRPSFPSPTTTCNFLTRSLHMHLAADSVTAYETLLK